MRLTPFVVTMLLLLNAHAVGQAPSGGTIEGTIVDRTTGEALIGATVILEGTALGAATDIEGAFVIRHVRAGHHAVRVSYIGYTARRMADVVVTDGASTRLDIKLDEESVRAEEVVVTARAVRSSEASILKLRQNAASIGDGISAEMIKRAPDATSADALKRVVGVSIMDDKYVLVRGVSDRYNQATLNGTSISSTDAESDKRSFSFDMIPSNLLENTVVVKSATPDKPGDFTGGLVEMRTMDFPDARSINLTVGSSMNTMTTGRSIAASSGGRTDWLGMDDGTRRSPAAGSDGHAAWRDLPNNWKGRTMRAPLSQSFSLSYGDHLAFDDFSLGLVAAVTYRGGYTRTETVQDFVIGSGPFRMSGTNDEYSVLWGGIAEMHVKLGDDHKLSFRNTYNRTAEDRIQERSGVDFQDREVRSISTQWTERSLYSGQISGQHATGFVEGMTLDWRWSYGTSNAAEPDRRRLKYQRQNGDTGPFAVTGTENNERAWTDLEEFTRGGGFDLQVPVGDARFKLGGSVESSDRAYRVLFTSAEFLGTDFTRTFLPADSIFLPQNFGPDLWTVRTLSSRSDEYDADRRVSAAYVMTDVPFQIAGQSFRVVGGVRWEDARLRAFTYQPAFIDGMATVETRTAELKNSDLLPSANLTYQAGATLNIRVAYSTSVNRPELREMAEVSYYDFVNYEEVRGNPDLRRAKVDNLDARIEWFPGVGEILAVSVFHKRIADAIEQKVVWSSNPGKQFINTPRADNYGLELEARSTLAWLGNGWDRIALTANYSRIISKVRFDEVRIVGLTPDFVPVKETFTDIRSMQGQASYTMNGGLHYTAPDWGTSVSVMVNRFGVRVDAVADIRDEDVFERPRATVDVSVAQKITPALEVKLTGRDLGASVRRFEFRTGQVYKNLKVGGTYGLQCSVSF